jgi:4'-phosphopantetheinyl transferase EntD
LLLGIRRVAFPLRIYHQQHARGSIREAMEILLKPGLMLSVAAIDDAQTDLHPVELELASDMSPRRLREFRAARTLGRLALTALGMEPSAIIHGIGGEPRWDSGILGSLAHSDTQAAALISTMSTCEAVGVDIVDDREITPAEAVDIMSAGEIEVILKSQIAPSMKERARELVFSVKEAVYKCQYPKTHWTDLDFNEVKVIQSSGGGSAVGIELLRNRGSHNDWFSRIEIQFKQFQMVTVVIATVTTRL